MDYFQQSNKKANTVKNYGKFRPPQNTPSSQHLNNRHCTMNTFSSLHAVLQSQKHKAEQGKAERRTRMIKGMKWVLIKELNRHGFFQPGRQTIKVVSKRSVINGAP